MQLYFSVEFTAHKPGLSQWPLQGSEASTLQVGP